VAGECEYGHVCVLMQMWLFALIRKQGKSIMTNKSGNLTDCFLNRVVNISPARLLLFFFLFWMVIVLAAGTGKYFFHPPTSSQLSYLAPSAEVYDTNSVFDHGFLGYLNASDLDNGKGYTNRSQPFMIANYVFLKVLKLMGLEYEVGQNFVVFIYFLFIFAIARRALPVVKRAERSEMISEDVLWLFIAIIIGSGLLVTFPMLWAGFVGYHRDNSFVISALCFAVLSIYDFKGGTPGRTSFIALLLITFFTPFYGPVVALAWFFICCFPRSSSDAVTGRKVFIECLILLLSSVFFLLLPKLTLYVIGLQQDTGSSFLFRSGLDGDNRVFSSLLSVIFSPFRPEVNRVWSTFFVPAAAVFFLAWHRIAVKDLLLNNRMARQLLICLLPYIYFLVVSPQGVAMHPYIYDFNLVFAFAFCLYFWILRKECFSNMGAGFRLGVVCLLASAVSQLQR